MDVSDEDLAQAAAGGDGGAFELLLNRHYDRIFALCFRFAGTRAEAEDLTQDICAALPAKLTSYKATAKFTTWLYRVAHNAAIDRRRKLASYTKALDGWGDWKTADAAADAEQKEAVTWLYRAMARLSENLRDTLALVLDDLTHAEVGEIMGVSDGTVSWRVAEAKKALRALKEEEEAI